MESSAKLSQATCIETDLDKKLKIEEYLKADDELDSSDDESLSDDVEKSSKKPSVLKIIIEKQETIEKTVSLLKKEIAQSLPIEKVDRISNIKDADEPASGPGQAAALVDATAADAKTTSQEATNNQPKPVKEEFDHLNNLLSDNKVQEMIRVVGLDTQNVIDKAMGAINSSKSIEDKRTAFSLGLRKLHMNLQTKKDVDRNPNYNFAMNLVGLRQQALRK